MGEQSSLGRFSFNPSIEILSQSESISFDAEVPRLRAAVKRTKIDSWISGRLQGGRYRRKVGHNLTELMQAQWLHLALESHNHADGARITYDPFMRPGRDLTPVVEGAGCLALKQTLARSLEILDEKPGLRVLREAVGELACRQILQENQGQPLKRLIMDVGDAPVHVAGKQTMGKSNRIRSDQMHHGILALKGDNSDLLGAAVRSPTRHPTGSAGGLVREMVRQQRGRSCENVLVRMVPASPCGDLLDQMEEDGIDFVVRIDHDSALAKTAGSLVYASSDLPPSGDGTRLYEMQHRADEWTRPRRMVLVVTEKPGELFHDYFGLMTNLPATTWESAALLEVWHQRGMAEQNIGTLVNFLAPAPLFSPRPRRHDPVNSAGHPPDGAQAVPGTDRFGPGSEALFLLNALAYNLMR